MFANFSPKIGITPFNHLLIKYNNTIFMATYEHIFTHFTGTAMSTALREENYKVCDNISHNVCSKGHQYSRYQDRLRKLNLGIHVQMFNDEIK